MKALVWCMVLIKNMVGFELETSWPRTFDWSDDKHLKQHVVCLAFWKHTNSAILGSISKTGRVGTGVTPRGTSYKAARFIFLCYYQWCPGAMGFTSHFAWITVLTLFIFPVRMRWVMCPVPILHPQSWAPGWMCFFGLVSVAHVYLGCSPGTAPVSNSVSC